MNAAHPDDNDAEIADVEGTQESDNSDQQAEKAKSEPPPHRTLGDQPDHHQQMNSQVTWRRP